MSFSYARESKKFKNKQCGRPANLVFHAFYNVWRQKNKKEKKFLRFYFINNRKDFLLDFLLKTSRILVAI